MVFCFINYYECHLPLFAFFFSSHRFYYFFSLVNCIFQRFQILTRFDDEVEVSSQVMSVFGTEMHQHVNETNDEKSLEKPPMKTLINLIKIKTKWHGASLCARGFVVICFMSIIIIAHNHEHQLCKHTSISKNY